MLKYDTKVLDLLKSLKFNAQKIKFIGYKPLFVGNFLKLRGIFT